MPPAREQRPTVNSYDRWFETRWGRYAFAVERDALLGAVGPLDGALVLDAGCGTGRFSVEFSRVGATVVGVDADGSMLAVAAHRRPGSLLVADISRLPFRDGAFDVTVAVTVVEFVVERHQALAELARVTRRGGRVAIAGLNPHSPWGLVHRRRSKAWTGACLLTPRDLASLGARHGEALVVSGALFAPGPVPGLSRVGPILERLGRGFARAGAFQVLVMQRR